MSNNSVAYRAWAAMKSRCEGTTNRDYAAYGGRGIKVCDRWQKFENFLEDMGEPPEGKSLDRIDNDKGYSKENCRWATPVEQSRNRRSSFFVEFKGEVITLREVAERAKFKYQKLWYRVRKMGMSPEEAVQHIR